MLVSTGVNVLAMSKNGKTALDLAREEGQKDSVDILTAAAVPTGTKVHIHT